MLEVRKALVAFVGASLASAVGGKRTRGKKQERAKQAQLILHYYAPLLKHFYQKTTPPHTARRIFCLLFLWGGKRVGYNIISQKSYDPQYE